MHEVSALLDVPEGTVKSRLFLARKQLKERLSWMVTSTGDERRGVGAGDRSRARRRSLSRVPAASPGAHRERARAAKVGSASASWQMGDRCGGSGGGCGSWDCGSCVSRHQLREVARAVTPPVVEPPPSAPEVVGPWRLKRRGLSSLLLCIVRAPPQPQRRPTSSVVISPDEAVALRATVRGDRGAAGRSEVISRAWSGVGAPSLIEEIVLEPIEHRARSPGSKVNKEKRP